MFWRKKLIIKKNLYRLIYFYYGLWAEYLVIFIYLMNFHNIISRRMRNYAGEIDIIAQKNNVIIFIEVKARSYKKLENEVLRSKQRNKIKKAAAVFISNNSRFVNHNLRFDLVIIKNYCFPVIIKNAW